MENQSSTPHGGINETFPLPFHKDELLSDKGFFTTVHESSVDNNYVVKESRGWLKDFQAERRLADCKEQYRQLKHYFSAYIPDSTFVLTDSLDSNVKQGDFKDIRIVQERIFEDVGLGEELKNQRVIEIKSFLLKCLEIFKSTYDPEKGSGVCVDISTNNFIFGHTSGNPTPRLYFIDTVRSIRTAHISMLREGIEEVIRDFNISGDEVVAELQKLG